MNMVAVLGAALFVALVLERLVELLVNPALPESLAPLKPYIAAVLGLLFAFGFNIDLVVPTLAEFDVTPAVGWAGRLVTGLVLGGGSNLIHDLWPGAVNE